MRVPCLCLAAAFVASGLPSCDTGSGGDADVGPIDGGDADDAPDPMPPDAMWGAYTVALDGDWVGVCTLTIARNAELRNLHVEREGWVYHDDGVHFTAEVTEEEGTWVFPFDIEVTTVDGSEIQHWDFEIPEAGVTTGGFEGGYTHTCEITGTSTGTATGTRR